MRFILDQGYLDAQDRLSTSDMGRAIDFMRKFIADPDRTGFDLKKPEGMRDPNIRSARVTDDLRAILYRDDGQTILLHVDHHDDAYEWARNRVFDRDALTGGIRVYSHPETVVEPEVAGGQAAPEAGPPPLFADCTDDYLLAIGVPKIWLPALRQVRREDALFDYFDHLPPEVVERLWDVAHGIPVPAAPEAGETPAEGAPTSYGLRRQIVLDNDAALADVLHASIAQWVAFMHPSQEAVALGAFRGPVKVTGSAGTGKTVVAMHRARHLARQGKRVLLTSYVTTLCTNIEGNLDMFCTPEERGRIDVRTVDSAATRIVRGADGDVTRLNDNEVRPLIERARVAVGCRFSASFLWAEWESVIAAQGIATWDAYRRADRSGRGKPLSVRDRRAVWDVYERVFAEMDSSRARDAAGMCRRATELLREGAVKRPYDAVIVDEVQDCTPQQILFLAALAGDGPDALTLAGDAGQRIYSRAFSLRKLGIETRGRSHILRINYRTTEQIRRAADRVRGTEVDDLDGEREGRTATRSRLRGPEPTLRGFRTADEQVEYVVAAIEGHLGAGLLPREVAVFGRTNRILDDLEQRLKDRGLPGHRLDGREPAPDGAVVLGTMHRAKGLEFKVVFVVNVSEDALPNPQALRGLDDPVDIAAAETRERQLLYVSMTRARDELYVTWVGQPSRLLPMTG